MIFLRYWKANFGCLEHSEFSEYCRSVCTKVPVFNCLMKKSKYLTVENSKFTIDRGPNSNSLLKLIHHYCGYFMLYHITMQTDNLPPIIILLYLADMTPLRTALMST